MFTYGPESYDFKTWSTTGDEEDLPDNNAWVTNLLSHKLACMADGAGPDDPSPIRAASPQSPSRSHSRTPFTRLKRKGPTLALHPAPTPRRPNLSPQSPQMVKAVMMLTQHPKRAKSLRKKMRWTSMAEPEMTAKAQMAMALTRKVLAVVAKLPMLMARTKRL